VASNEPIWHPEALSEAEDARNWYADRSPLAARGFLLALEEAVTSIMESPKRWPERRYRCRHYIFPNQYPYTLVYRVTGKIEIVAVAHQKRRPYYWKHR
jgi:plasmid stabilization system protein ParE